MVRKCKNCGDKFEARRAEVNRGNGNFCGLPCAATHRNNQRPKTGKTKLTYAQRKEKYGDGYVIGQLVGRIQGRARKAEVPCDITAVMFKEMWLWQSGRCHYTGRKMTINGPRRTSFGLDKVSVDRFVPMKGYVRDNIVLCCRWVNVAKGQATIKEIKKRAKELLER